MEEKNNIQKRIIFDDSFLEIINNLLQKYNLVETTEDFFSKLKADKKTLSEIVMEITKNFFRGVVKETDLPSLFINNLNMPEETARALSRDIKEKIIPLIKEGVVSSEEYQSEGHQEENIENKETDDFPKTEPPIGVTEALNKNKIIAETGQAEKTKKTIPQKKIEKPAPQSRRSRVPDNYREPIE